MHLPVSTCGARIIDAWQRALQRARSTRWVIRAHRSIEHAPPAREPVDHPTKAVQM